MLQGHNKGGRYLTISISLCQEDMWVKVENKTVNVKENIIERSLTLSGRNSFLYMPSSEC